MPTRMSTLRNENGSMDGCVKGLAVGTVVVGLCAQAWLYFVGPSDPPARDTHVPLAAITVATVPVPCEEFLASSEQFSLELMDGYGVAPFGVHRIEIENRPSSCVLNGRYGTLSLVLRSCNSDAIQFFATGDGVAQTGDGRCTADKATGTLSSTDVKQKVRRYRFTITRA